MGHSLSVPLHNVCRMAVPAFISAFPINGDGGGFQFFTVATSAAMSNIPRLLART